MREKFGKFYHIWKIFNVFVTISTNKPSGVHSIVDHKFLSKEVPVSLCRLVKTINKL